MRKSLEYSIGGASFLIVGTEMLFSVLFAATSGGESAGFILLYTVVGTLLAGIGGYWLWAAQRFYKAELAPDGRTAPGI